MRIVLQRVKKASVEIDNSIVGSISQGYVVLLGVGGEDTQEDADWLVNKISQLRIFSDEEGKMNLSIEDIKGEFLVVSQFTLFAKTKKGNRPSFIKSAPPEIAIPLYKYFKEKLQHRAGLKVASGEFGADMQVSLVNDGPVTITIDTKNKE